MNIRKIIIAVLLVASLVVLGAGISWNYHHRHDADSIFTVPQVACGILSISNIEEITGREVTWYASGHEEMASDNLRLSCRLGLEGFADLRIAYSGDPWFLSQTNRRISEEYFKNFPTYPRWPIETLDTDLDGNTYLTVVGDRDSTLAYAANYSFTESGPRTLSLGVITGLTTPEPSLSDAEIRETTIALFTYLVETVEEHYPTTAQPTPPSTTASAQES
ncbi:hypothetical protein [Actinomyces howellii]|uniref:hypothetical protein n=1 Tax=Actinomyces howellii TaxID=52771 RepID=UPI000F83B30F|nr:hypothetical protein [Actinomyces howellii]